MVERFLQHPALAGCGKGGCAEGRGPFAGSLRVSLKYNFFSFLARQENEGLVERDFWPHS